MTLDKKTRALLALTAALAFAGCGDDDSTDDPGDDPMVDMGTTDMSSDDDLGGGPVTTESYVVTVHDGDSDITYLAQVDDLAAGTTVGFTGPQVPGSVIAVASGDDPYVYVGSSSSVLYRYVVTADGIELDDEVDFINEGTTAINGYQSALFLVDETKGYFLDLANNQVVIWNPTDMTVTGAEDFSETVTGADIRSGHSGFPIQIGTKYYYGLGFIDSTTLGVLGGAAMLVIDSADDSATVFRDPMDRCGYTFSIAEGTDGIYLASESYAAANHALDDSAPAPCMVRFDPETETFDETFQQDLTALVGGTAAGTVVPGPTAGEAYLRVLEESELPCTVEQWSMGDSSCPAGGAGPRARLLSVQAAWKWYELTLGDTPVATEMPDAVLTSGATLGINSGAEILVPEFEGTATDLRDFTGNVYGDIVLESEGYIRSIAKVTVVTE